VTKKVCLWEQEIVVVKWVVYLWMMNYMKNFSIKNLASIIRFPFNILGMITTTIESPNISTTKTTTQVPIDLTDFYVGFEPTKDKYFIRNKVTSQYLLVNGKVGEYRDIGEGISGWYNTKEQAEDMLYRSYYCHICGKFLGVSRSYSEITCPGERAGRSMGDYYGRRDHYTQCHRIGTDEARGYTI
jgi:hypothetical protein